MERPVVRAKFYVQAITPHYPMKDGEPVPGAEPHSTTLNLSAVCRGEDNKQWASATPAGTLTMTVRNQLAVDRFEIGDEFYLDFVPAPKGSEGMDR